MKEYVLGFLFNDSGSRVALIHKNRPAHLAGLWNGLGGKIEASDANPWIAMCREFTEETGANTPTWLMEGEYVGSATDHDRDEGWKMFVFSARSTGILNTVFTAEDEEVNVFDMDNLPPNLAPSVKKFLTLGAPENWR